MGWTGPGSIPWPSLLHEGGRGALGGPGPALCLALSPGKRQEDKFSGSRGHWRGHHGTAAGLGTSQTTSGVLRGHEGCSIPGVAQSISHPGTWRYWSSCSWRQPLSRHLGQFPALSPSLGQDSVPGGWTGMLSRPMCCQGFPSPLCGCASPVPQKRLPGFSPVHTQPVGVCSTNTSLEDAGTFCARLSSAPLGAARSRVEQKEVSDTQNSSVPGSDDRKSMFCTQNDVGAASPALPFV